MILPPPHPTLFPFTTLFRSSRARAGEPGRELGAAESGDARAQPAEPRHVLAAARTCRGSAGWARASPDSAAPSSDRKSTRLNSSHLGISYAVFRLKKKTGNTQPVPPVLAHHTTVGPRARSPKVAFARAAMNALAPTLAICIALTRATAAGARTAPP